MDGANKVRVVAYYKTFTLIIQTFDYDPNSLECLQMKIQLLNQMEKSCLLKYPYVGNQLTFNFWFPFLLIQSSNNVLFLFSV